MPPVALPLAELEAEGQGESVREPAPEAEAVGVPLSPPVPEGDPDTVEVREAGARRGRRRRGTRRRWASLRASW